MRKLEKTARRLTPQMDLGLRLPREVKSESSSPDSAGISWKPVAGFDLPGDKTGSRGLKRPDGLGEAPVKRAVGELSRAVMEYRQVAPEVGLGPLT